MKGNPTAGIILLVAASLFIALGTKYKERVKGAWQILINGAATTTTKTESEKPPNAKDIKTPQGGVNA